MTRWGANMEDLSARGRCTKCRKIDSRTAPLGLCPRCTAWTDGGTVGPTPLAPELAEPYLLKDQGPETGDDGVDGEDHLYGFVQRAIEAPGMAESLAFVEEHRHHDCPEYGGCLSMAVHLDWFWFTCRGCRLFPKKTLDATDQRS